MYLHTILKTNDTNINNKSSNDDNSNNNANNCSTKSVTQSDPEIKKNNKKHFTKSVPTCHLQTKYNDTNINDQQCNENNNNMNDTNSSNSSITYNQWECNKINNILKCNRNK